MTADPELVAYLRSLGAADELLAATPEGALPRLATDLVLGAGHTRTPADVAAELGRPTGDVVEIYRLLGITVSPDRPELGDGDVELLGLLTRLEGAAGQWGDLLRVIGGSLARIADAAVAAYVQGSDDERARPVQPLEEARNDAEIAALGVGLGGRLGVLFVHHLHEAIARQRATQSDIGDRSVGRFAVGFVDLVGSTALTLAMSRRELVESVRRFESVGFDIATAHGGRVVKHIGDEVMFTALDVDAAGRIALDLVAGFGPNVVGRGGVTFGEVVTLHGDHYGPVVNLASRLVDQAVPGEVLVDADTAAHLTSLPSTPAGRRMLKGIDQPVAVASLGPA